MFKTGTAEIINTTENSFQSNVYEKNLWIFISRVKDTVTEETVQNTLKTKLNLRITKFQLNV